MQCDLDSLRLIKREKKTFYEVDDGERAPPSTSSPIVREWSFPRASKSSFLALISPSDGKSNLNDRAPKKNISDVGKFSIL
jgi:hypothetical protein